MSQKPIAWVGPQLINGVLDVSPVELERYKPLYAHPQKELIQQQAKEIEQLKANLHNVNVLSAKEIKQLKFLLKNLILASNKKMEELEKELNDCTCQGGHSKEYLKAKGKL
jgi:hypothetical protein